MTNIQPNEISLYYHSELESKAQHSHVNTVCIQHFASDGPRSDSRKSTFPLALNNLTPIYKSLSQLSSNFLSPQSLPSATRDYSTFCPSHILNNLPRNQFPPLWSEDDSTQPHRATREAHRNTSYTQQIQVNANCTCPLQPSVSFTNQSMLTPTSLQEDLNSSLFTFFGNLILTFFYSLMCVWAEVHVSIPPIRMQRQHPISMSLLHEASTVWWVQQITNKLLNSVMYTQISNRYFKRNLQWRWLYNTYQWSQCMSQKYHIR